MHRVQLFPVRCTVSQSPCGARCPNPRAVHGVPIPVRLLTGGPVPEEYYLARIRENDTKSRSVRFKVVDRAARYVAGAKIPPPLIFTTREPGERC
jgi:hypothetical protein